jgi:hypothetical protein
MDIPTIGELPPKMDDAKIEFSEEQKQGLLALYKAYEGHFDACCAFHMDKCRYAGEYIKLCSLLELAGFDTDNMEGYFQ